MQLRGRRSERDALEQLLDGARAGHSSVLILCGESGVGKTALLDDVLGRASGYRIARVGGVESEMELAYAGLQQLCAPMLDRLGHLPAPQRDALRLAFGLSEGPAPDRFLVGLAVLSLLCEVAEERPLVCLVDDVQWLDQASVQALAFVARRLMAEPVVLVFAVRELSDQCELVGLPELAVTGIGDSDARLLLESAVPGRLDEQVRDRIVAETRGNPLALLELPRGMTPAQLAGGFGLPCAQPLASRIQQSFLRRLRSLPHQTQQLLLIAAAEPLGDVTLLWRAAERLGIGADAAAPAEAAGLIELGARIRFRHPLVRSASYHTSSPQDRQRAHAALAEATDPQTDPDRRAWHHAHAAHGPDEAVASELERSADRAQRRGGVAAAAAFLDRAAALTGDPTRLGARALAAARAKFDAAAPDAADELLATAAMCPLDDLQCAQLERLRAQIAFARTRGSDALALLLGAAKRLEPLDPELARETYLEALWAAVRTGRFGSCRAVAEAAQAARAAPAPRRPPRAIDLLLDGLVVRFTEGYAAAAPRLERALDAFRHAGLNDVGWCWLACHVAMDLWDDEACAQLVGDLIQTARDTGALAALPFALNYVSAHQIFAGEFSAAEELIEEAEAITAATRNARIADFSVLLAAWRGDRARTFDLREASIQDATERGEGFVFEVAEWAAAVLHNGLGEYGLALVAAQQALEQDELGFAVWVLPELIEAAARTGGPIVAASALERLTERTCLSSSDWALGIDARSRALLSDGRLAEDLYLEAIDRLGRSRVTVHLARAHLIYGEWLRRENRRVDARERLRAAYNMFDTMGAEAFAERARRELVATGEKVRRRTVETRDELTPQEAQIARLARDGYTSPEIGVRLFISPRTVDYHLRKVFTKLDITSRKQLRTVLPNTPPRDTTRDFADAAGAARGDREVSHLPGGDGQTDRPQPGDQPEVHVACHRQAGRGFS
jgi:DNA-binding CsgD family transcriptional regulator